MSSQWRYAALMATGVVAGMAWGRGLAVSDSLAEWLSLGSSWLILFLVTRLVAPALFATMRLQQQWREERRRQRES